MFKHLKKMLEEKEKQSRLNIQSKANREKNVEVVDLDKFCLENPGDHQCKMYDV